MAAPNSNLADLDAGEAADGIARGEFTSVDLVGACLDRIAERDDAIRAWAHLDPDYAFEQARQRDGERQSGQFIGPLHGVPVGVKDIFDTHDMPTEDGSALHAGNQPDTDASAVALLRQAGAVILGKTVTTEFAFFTPGKTANPHDPGRTPGGSSSGSAASVAAKMLPLAIGSQTAGSVIRPASFCGVVGFKPSHGLIPRHRVLQLSRRLDHVGVFARRVEDAALLAENLIAFDENDPDTKPRSRPALCQVALEDPPVTPRLAFIKTPVWDRAEKDTKEAFAELVAHINETVGDAAPDTVQEAELPEIFVEAHDWHATIMEADIAGNLEHEYETGKDKLSERLRETIERGQKVRALDYNRALDGAEVLGAALASVFAEFDAILTPTAPGEAPKGLDATGDPVFCVTWTLCGVPAISLPLLEGSGGMPMGAQLVGATGDDARLLRTARWLVSLIADEGGS